MLKLRFADASCNLRALRHNSDKYDVLKMRLVVIALQLCNFGHHTPNMITLLTRQHDQYVTAERIRAFSMEEEINLMVEHSAVLGKLLLRSVLAQSESYCLRCDDTSSRATSTKQPRYTLLKWKVCAFACISVLFYKDNLQLQNSAGLTAFLHDRFNFCDGMPSPCTSTQPSRK